MKAVLLSIKPKFCELIASGKKTVEIRKNRPGIDVPSSVYDDSFNYAELEKIMQEKG